MVTPRLPVSVLMAAVVALSGCGSGSKAPPGQASGRGSTYTVGSLQVTTAQYGVPLNILALQSPPASHLAFTCLSGATITRLAEIGYARIAFDSVHGTVNPEILVMNADGTGRVNLSQNPASDQSPAWSPDGQKIAFTSRRGQPGTPNIWVMNADGSNPVTLTTGGRYNEDPAWSPNGAKIAFTSYRDQSDAEIYVMNADGSGQSRLTRSRGFDGSPAWSPDGRRIAFIRRFEGAGQKLKVWVMNADGSGQGQVTSGPVDDYLPSWSPDGRLIAFVSDRNGNRGDIYTITPSGSGLTRLTGNAGRDSAPAWSPDGRQIAFSSDREGTFSQLYVMGADGSNERNLSPSGAEDLAPAWCPAPGVRRGLIGGPGTDGGSNPPFGTQRPLVVVGATADGLVSAATVTLAPGGAQPPTAEALHDIGVDVAGVQISADGIDDVREDLGRGLPPRVWSTGDPATGTVVVFFSGKTGRIASTIAGGGTAGPTVSEGKRSTARSAGSRLVLKGNFTAVRDARDPRRNLASRPAREVTLDSRTGLVLSTK